MSCSYLHLPPPKFNIYSDVLVGGSRRQIVGVSRRHSGDIIYYVWRHGDREVIAVPESRVKSDYIASTHGFIWHLDVHFADGATYHVEEFDVDEVAQPLSLREVDILSWREGSNNFVEWLTGISKGTTDAILTLRTYDGWYIDSWHLYELVPSLPSEEFGVYRFTLSYSRHSKGKVEWDQEVSFDYLPFNQTCVAHLGNVVRGKRIEKKAITAAEIKDCMCQMRERYQDIRRFFFDTVMLQELNGVQDEIRFHGP